MNFFRRTADKPKRAEPNNMTPLGSGTPPVLKGPLKLVLVVLVVPMVPIVPDVPEVIVVDVMVPVALVSVDSGTVVSSVAVVAVVADADVSVVTVSVLVFSCFLQPNANSARTSNECGRRFATCVSNPAKKERLSSPPRPALA